MYAVPLFLIASLWYILQLTQASNRGAMGRLGETNHPCSLQDLLISFYSPHFEEKLLGDRSLANFNCFIFHTIGLCQAFVTSLLHAVSLS